MVTEFILQEWLTSIALPFLLIFFIVFAILEKTGIFGEDKKQINAMIAFVIAMIFVGAVFPKLVVGNLILFLTVAIVVMFVGLLLWGFLTGGKAKVTDGTLKKVGVAVIVVAVIIALLWAMGISGEVWNFLFNQTWSTSFWTNFLFLVVIAGAIALVLRSGGSSESSG